MLELNNAISINRKQLYDEIWEISVVGVAKKYNVPYSRVTKLCKDNNIPTPSTAYWTRLSFGKDVEKIPLPESAITEVVLDTSIVNKSTRGKVAAQNRVAVKTPAEKAPIKAPVEKAVNMPPTKKVVVAVEVKPEPDPVVEYKTVTGVYNTYKREMLYDEVWNKSVVEVAISYGVSDVTILKVCKSLNLPLPPRGYWAMKDAGEKIEKTPLPETNGPTQKTGLRSYVGVKNIPETKAVLGFLDEEERRKVLDAATHLMVDSESGLLHKKIVAYKSVVSESYKNDKKDDYAQRAFRNYSQRPPFLTGVISKETIPRVYRLLDALYREVERLGGSINEDLSLQIRNEHVRIEISESQDEKRHEITRQEAQAFIKYQDAERHHSWAPEPKIRKNDFIFNGKLRISVLEGKYFRDSVTESVEDKIGEILIDLYEESEVIRMEQEAWRERKRKSEEEERNKEARRNRYNEEVERTIALQNEALDFEIASRIRAYILAIRNESSQAALDDETNTWIEWASSKADWFDPIVARSDDFFGKRQHGKNADKKALERAGYYW